MTDAQCIAIIAAIHQHADLVTPALIEERELSDHLAVLMARSLLTKSKEMSYNV